MTKEEKQALKRALSQIGRLGGLARAASQTPRQRKALALKAGLARQGKARRDRGGVR